MRKFFWGVILVVGLWDVTCCGSVETVEACDQLVAAHYECYCSTAKEPYVPQEQIDEVCHGPKERILDLVPEADRMERCDPNDAVWAQIRLDLGMCYGQNGWQDRV